MIDFIPDSATFAAVVADRRFPLAFAISILSGMVRGFSGFGAALIYVPLMSAVYGPRIAAPSFLVIDLVTGLIFMSTLWRRATWREIYAAHGVGADRRPARLRAAAVRRLIALRWGISILVLLVVGVLMTGWRYHGRPSLMVTIMVGLLSNGGSSADLRSAGHPLLAPAAAPTR